MAFLALLALSVFAHTQEPPRLRTLLPNGSVLLVENLPDSKIASVQLFASSLRLPDTPEIHGYKHLLEHLILKGPKKDLDRRMESQGIYFTGRTLRDAMQVEFSCAPNQVPQAFQCLGEILQPLKTSAKEIAAEVSIMRQESALRTDAQRLSGACWNLAFGKRGLDPFGDVDTMSKATPDALAAFQEQLFAANDLVLVISGPLDIEAITKSAKEFLNQASGKNLGMAEPMPSGVGGRVQIADAFGEARGARIPGISDKATAAALAAGLALETQLPYLAMSYTPGAGPGLVVISKTDQNSGLGLKIDAMDEAEAAALLETGRRLALAWLSRQLANPSSSAEMRGLLLCEGPDNAPESMADNLKHLTWQDFVKGVKAFTKDEADIAVGSR